MAVQLYYTRIELLFALPRLSYMQAWASWITGMAETGGAEMTREEAFKRLEQMYDFYAHAMDANKNYPLKGDAEAIKVALLVMAQDRSAHITREQVEKIRGEWKVSTSLNGCTYYWDYICSNCGVSGIPNQNFCERCGIPLTDKAVDILWKRLEAMQDAAD